jgi:hypothetical protein
MNSRSNPGARRVRRIGMIASPMIAFGLSVLAHAQNIDGRIDPSFGSHGAVLLDIAPDSDDEANSMQILPNGNIVLGGTCMTGEPIGYTFCAAQLQPNGSYDYDHFGPSGNGRVRFDQFGFFPDHVFMSRMIRLRDGRLLFVGITTSDYEALAAVLKPGGTALDTSFGDRSGTPEGRRIRSTRSNSRTAKYSSPARASGRAATMISP